MRKGVRLALTSCLVAVLSNAAGTAFGAGGRSILPQLNANGSVRTDYYRSDKWLTGEADYFGLTADVRMQPVFGEWLDGTIDMRFTTPDIGHSRQPAKAVLRDAYLAARGEHYELRVGKQTVAWGRADAVNPTDNLTPRDRTILLPFDEDQRFGTVSLKGDWYAPRDYAVSVFYSPCFDPSVIPLPIPPGADVVQRLPDRTFDNSEAGVKLDKSGGAFDWSVSYYHGFSLIPEIRLREYSPATGMHLELRYPPIDVIGADADRNFGRYGVRAEAAHIRPASYDSGEPTAISPFVFFVIGADRTFGDTFNVNVQLLGRIVQDYTDPAAGPDPVQNLLSVGNAVLFGQRRRRNYGFSGRIADRFFHGTLEAELLLLAYLQPSNEYLRSRITYAFTDRLKGTLGSERYFGPHDSLFGSLKQNRTWFLEMRYYF